MSLILHRSATTKALAAELADLLASSPADVFTPEVIAVGGRGIERWLTQRLSHHLGSSVGEDGVCAGLDVSSPASLMGMIRGDHDDPWAPERLVWRVLAVIDDVAGSPEYETVGRYLGVLPWPGEDDSAWRARARTSRRYALARKIAGFFARYSVERPHMMALWEQGDDDGIADDLRWQVTLWREVVQRYAAEGITETPSARLHRVCGELRTAPEKFDLPKRVSFFGHTRFAQSELLLLAALAQHRDVHLWMTNPSPALWDVLQENMGASSEAPQLRAQDDSAAYVEHPLLAALGRESRENEQVLLSVVETEKTPLLDASAAPSPTPMTRLELLQADILANRVPTTTPIDDDSIAVHACHGPARSVEVLREELLDILESSGGQIQPRDILIMCPDVETYAPLIRAAFGSSDEESHPGHLLPVRMADRGVAALNPLVDIALNLLTLVASRFTASQVLDLAGKTPVAMRFGFDDDARAYLTRWVSESGIRWGLSAQHRREYGVGAFTENTWEAGLDRIALGAVMAADSPSLLASCVPVDDVSGSSAQVAASFMELMASLEKCAAVIRGTSATHELTPGTFTVAEWASWVRESVLAITAVEPAMSWQIAQFERDIASVTPGSHHVGLRLSDARALFENLWAPKPTRANFRTGAITVCTMVPMRSVPHKVVVTLGMDDGAYPRQARSDGDDVLARSPHVGERDVRSVDGELLLDAVMSASEKFVVVYCGFDERTGAERPPAIPVQQLISAASRTGAGDEACDLVTTHPLQAFDERNFAPPTPSFDAASLAGAQALRDYRHEIRSPQPFLAHPLEAKPPATALTLDDLTAFFVKPAREFLRRRLEVTSAHEEDELSNAIPLDLDGLDQWKIGDRYLKARLAGLTPQQAWNIERRRGALPPGDLAQQICQSISRNAEHILAGYSPDRESVEVHVALDGVTLGGVVSGVNAQSVEELTYSTVKADHRIRAWIRLLALCASEDNAPQVSIIRSKRDVTGLRAPDQVSARNILQELIGIREAGLREPLGIPPQASAAYVESLMISEKFRREVNQARDVAQDNAREVWSSSKFPENADAWYERVYGPSADFKVLMTASGIPTYAETIWRPILDAEARYAG